MLPVAKMVLVLAILGAQTSAVALGLQAGQGFKAGREFTDGSFYSTPRLLQDDDDGGAGEPDDPEPDLPEPDAPEPDVPEPDPGDGGGDAGDDGPGGQDDLPGNAGDDGDDQDDGAPGGRGDLDDDFLAGTSEASSSKLGDDEERDDQGFLITKGQVIAVEPTARSLELARSLGFQQLLSVRLRAIGTTAVILSAPSRMTTKEALELLRSRDPGRTYDYNHIYDFRLSTGAPVRPPRAYKPTRQALSLRSDLSIGLIDTALNPNHAGFKGAKVVQRDFVAGGRSAPSGHGTAVGSILLDRQTGLVPNARVFVASVFRHSVRGDSVGAAVELSRALDWLVEQQVTVINMSLAGPRNQLLERAVARTVSKGHLIIAAVGNEGPAAYPMYPAAFPAVIGVTALDESLNVYRRAGRGAHVDFSAPGVNVFGALGEGYAMHSGTSFAAPYAAAIISLGASLRERRGTQLWLEQLSNEALDLGARGRDDVYGHGLLRLSSPKSRQQASAKRPVVRQQ